jgi:hypothetical protein
LNVGEKLPDFLSRVIYPERCFHLNVGFFRTEPEWCRPRYRLGALCYRSRQQNGALQRFFLFARSRPDGRQWQFPSDFLQSLDIRHLHQDPLYGTDDSGISRTSTKIPAEFETDTRFVGLGKSHHNVARSHEHPRRAESTLQSMFQGKSPTQLYRDRIILKALDRGDRSAFTKGSISNARASRLTVDQDSTSTTNALLAPQVGTGQPYFLAKEVCQVNPRFDCLDNRLSIDREAKLSHHVVACLNARCITVIC